MPNGPLDLESSKESEESYANQPGGESKHLLKLLFLTHFLARFDGDGLLAALNCLDFWCTLLGNFSQQSFTLRQRYVENFHKLNGAALQHVSGEVEPIYV